MATGRHAQRRGQMVVHTGRRRGRHGRPASTRSRAAAFAVVPLVLAGGTGAYAYWSATGTGSAAVPSATAALLTVTATGTPPSLYPGRTISLDVTLANSNVYPVSITKLTAVSVASSDAQACSPSANITVSSTVTSTFASGGYTLPAPIAVAAGGSTNTTLANLITMNTTALDPCQGKTFTVTLTFTGSQV